MKLKKLKLFLVTTLVGLFSFKVFSVMAMEKFPRQINKEKVKEKVKEDVEKREDFELLKDKELIECLEKEKEKIKNLEQELKNNKDYYSNEIRKIEKQIEEENVLFERRYKKLEEEELKKDFNLNYENDFKKNIRYFLDKIKSYVVPELSNLKKLKKKIIRAEKLLLKPGEYEKLKEMELKFKNIKFKIKTEIEDILVFSKYVDDILSNKLKSDEFKLHINLNFHIINGSSGNEHATGYIYNENPIVDNEFINIFAYILSNFLKLKDYDVLEEELKNKIIEFVNKLSLLVSLKDNSVIFSSFKNILDQNTLDQISFKKDDCVNFNKQFYKYKKELLEIAKKTNCNALLEDKKQLEQECEVEENITNKEIENSKSLLLKYENKLKIISEKNYNSKENWVVF